MLEKTSHGKDVKNRSYWLADVQNFHDGRFG